MVTWASKDKHNRPKLVEGTVLGFIKSPSFTYVVIKSEHNRIVKHLGSEIILF